VVKEDPLSREEQPVRVAKEMSDLIVQVSSVNKPSLTCMRWYERNVEMERRGWVRQRKWKRTSRAQFEYTGWTPHLTSVVPAHRTDIILFVKKRTSINIIAHVELIALVAAVIVSILHIDTLARLIILSHAGFHIVVVSAILFELLTVLLLPGHIVVHLGCQVVFHGHDILSIIFAAPRRVHVLTRASRAQLETNVAASYKSKATVLVVFPPVVRLAEILAAERG